MKDCRPRWTRVALASAVTLLGTGLVGPDAAASVAVEASVGRTASQVEDDGLLMESFTSYRVDPPGGAVHVSVDLTLTNQLGPLYFFPRIGVPVLTEAVNVAATRDDGRALSVDVEPGNEFVSAAVIDLSPDLNSGQTQRVTLTLDLPALPPRSDGFTRVNAAFVSFPAFGVGDVGEVDIEIRVPTAMEVDLVGEDMERTDAGAEDVYSATAIAAPLEWTAFVIARDDAALVARELEVGGHEVVVRAWPDDAAWADFVAAQLERALPVLEELVGQPWPEEELLGIIETAAPYAYGYAGWYSSADNTIEIGDEFLPIVITHELAHIWFNQRLFSDRWVNEAFAQEFAWRTLERLGEPPPPPDPVVPDDPAAFRLNGWGDPLLLDEDSDAREGYGYNTAWSLLHQVSTEVSVERVADVIAAASDRTIAYRGDPEPEQGSTSTSWQRLLDLLQEVGGSEMAEGLFRTYVATEVQLAEMDERARLRALYDELESAGDGWTPPEPVRTSMSGWQFEQAEERIAVATAALDDRDEIVADAEGLDLAVPGVLEMTYESADEIDDVVSLLEEHLLAINAVVEADAAVGADRGLFAKVGLVGGRAEADLREAREQFVEGDPGAALLAATAARDRVADAESVGKQRVLMGALALVLAVAVFEAARRIHRRRRRPDPGPGPATIDWAVLDPPAT